MDYIKMERVWQDNSLFYCGQFDHVADIANILLVLEKWL